MKKSTRIFLSLVVVSIVGLITTAIIYAATENKVVIVFLFVFIAIFLALLLPPIYLFYLSERKYIAFYLSAIFHIGLAISIIPFGIFKYIIGNERWEMISLALFGISLLGIAIVIATNNIITEIKKPKANNKNRKDK